MSSAIPYAFGAVFAVGGFIILVGAFKSLGRARAVLSWPSVEGKLVSASVKTRSGRMTAGSSSSGRSFEAVASYSYAVGGKSYRGHRIGVGDYRSISERRVRAKVDELAAAPGLSVRYRPDKPEEAFLEAKAYGFGLSLLLGLFCMGVGALAIGLGPAFLAFFTS